MFYKRYLQLCDEAKLTPSAAATKAGFNRGTVSVWKKKYEAGVDVTPDRDVINKICAFFGCTESWIRGITTQEEKAAPADTSNSDASDEGQLMAAFFEGGEDLSEDEMAGLWQDAKDYISWKLAQRRKANNGQQ